MSTDYERLYNQYKAFLYRICSRYLRPGVEMDDLMQMAYIGLYNAVNSYKDGMSASFITYLGRCVSNYIITELGRSGSAIRVSQKARMLMSRYRQAERELCQALSRYPTRREIADRLQLTEEQLARIEAGFTAEYIGSIDAPLAYDADTATAEMIVDDNAMTAETYETEEFRRCLWDTVRECLDDCKYKYLCDYYREQISLAALAQRDGLTTESIRSHIRYALDKLRADRRVRQIFEDYGYIEKYRHVTLTEFKHTFTSAVEREVLDKERYLERYRRRIKGVCVANG